MLYFAYGSNLDVRVMRTKGVSFVRRRAARLPDYALRFDKRALRPGAPQGVGYANIAPAAGECVEGALYELTAGALVPLDRSERHPVHYRRTEVEIIIDGANHTAFVYQANPDKTAANLAPSRDYLDRLLAAEDLFSPDYRQRLERVATFRAPCAVCAIETEICFDRHGDHVRSRCFTCGMLDVI